MRQLTITATLLFFCATFMFAQKKSYAVYSIAFYNLENLFDTVDDPDNPGDDEFLPESAYNWTQDKYEKKQANMAKVLSRIGREYSPLGPAIIGVAEVENRAVLEDLVKQKEISDMNLKVIHEESPDWRGIDVGLLYNPDLFTLENYKAHPFVMPSRPDYRTRDHLLVSGWLAGEKIHVIVNHWPSRFGGKKSSILRETAAASVNMITDSIYAKEPEAKIIIMGDLNDDPNDKSVKKVLNAKKKQKDVKPQGLFNPMWNLYSQGVGSLAYQGKWSLFDQIIVSHELLGDNYSSLKYWRAEIFNNDFLIQKEGKNKGYPLRTFSGETFINGYSDHFPALIYLLKEIE